MSGLAGGQSHQQHRRINAAVRISRTQWCHENFGDSDTAQWAFLRSVVGRGRRWLCHASDQISEFKEAVRMVMRGYSFAPAQDFPTAAHRRYGASDEQRLRMLSAREMTVLILLAKGMGNKQIGAQLSLSEKTVSTYKHRLKLKLNITSVVELIDFARRYHLL
ncbi:response regulator transcription factor (plasmid) [Pseudomonas silvicola]|nr:response regulator transcription factor [Pseudomonas silvicola]